MLLQGLSNQMTQILNNNSWEKEINRIKLHQQLLQLVDKERNKQTQLTLTSSKDLLKLREMFSHKRQKRLEEVEEPRSLQVLVQVLMPIMQAR